jgi:hypothetical protein
MAGRAPADEKVTTNVLVLVSFGLVLLATILLVVGLLTDDAMELIYLSIACSFTAAVVLWMAFRRARPKQDGPSEPPAPLLPEGEEPAEEPTTVAPVVAEPEAEGAELVNPGATPTADTEPAVAEAGDDDWVDDDDWADAGDFEVEFPIADYDELEAEEILPLLPQLYSDELEVVAERERATKDRQVILDRLAELADTGTEADQLEEQAAEPEPEPEPQPQRQAAPTRTARPAPQVPSLSDDDWDDEIPFPIADYDELDADQIIPLLSQLEDDELEDVKAREVAGSGRKSVISEIDRQLGLVDADEAEPAMPEPAAPAPAGRRAPQAEAPQGSALAIAGYDGLTVAQIRPLLADLSAAELQAVLDHEVARDNRRTIVNEIERRLASVDEPAPAAPAPARPAKKAASAPAAKKATKRTANTATKRTAKTATKRTAKKSASAPTAKKAAKRATKKAAANRFPIADYDGLSVAQIRPKLATLDDGQLRQVREREVSGAGRKTILTEIDKRLS